MYYNNIPIYILINIYVLFCVVLLMIIKSRMQFHDSIGFAFNENDLLTKYGVALCKDNYCILQTAYNQLITMIKTHIS